MSASSPREESFSLVYGGPLMRLLGRIGVDRPWPKVLAFVVLTWVPLLILSAVASFKGRGELRNFLFDLPAVVRFLIAAPILVLAGRTVHEFTSHVVDHFRSSGLVRETELGPYQKAVDALVRGRESAVAEGVIIAAAYLVAWAWFRSEVLGGSTGWHARSGPEGLRMLPAGFWYAFVSVPVYEFVLGRWLYRALLWTQFLWRTSRLKLFLAPTHPDGTGGLLFLGAAQASFAPILFAAASVSSAVQMQQILRGVTTFQAIKWPLAVVVIVIYPVLSLLPLVVFTWPLVRARRRAMLADGALGTRYVRLFEKRWGPGGTGSDAELLGSSDIQSLADLQGSLAVADQMRIVPFTRKNALTLLVAGALPFVPLFLTDVPLETVLQIVLKIVV